ncbi:MAG: hypothetical protein ACR2FI_07175 [Burkholderiales bacterium]|nr:hypothetical protein [Burkholderiales bacterium]MDQ3195363.1 hypothetical protein [Pseudomonadota bacterium]
MSDLKNEASGSATSRDPGSASNTAQLSADAPRDYAKEYEVQSSEQAARSQSKSASDDTDEVIERTRRQASQLMTDAKQKGQSMIEEKKHLAADEIAGMANVLRKTAENLNQEDRITTGRYAEQAAAGLDRLSTTLRDRDITTLLHQAQSFARRSPGLFFGGAVAAGFFFSRFVKSTGVRSESDDYGDSSGGSGSDFSRKGSRGAWESRDTGVRPGYAEATEAGPGDRAGSGSASQSDALGDTAHNLQASGKPNVPMPRSAEDMSRNTDPDSPYGADSRSLPHTDKRSGGPNAN